MSNKVDCPDGPFLKLGNLRAPALILAGVVGAVPFLGVRIARAACQVTPAGLVACSGTTSTRRAVNTDGDPAGADDRTQRFDNGASISASIARGAIIRNSGLRLSETGPAPRSITLDNDANVQGTKTNQTLRIDGNGGPIAYGGNGRITNTGKTGTALSIDGGAGAVSIAAGGGLVQGAHAIGAVTTTGALSVTTGAGAISGTNGQGIDAQTTTGALSITTGKGKVSGHGQQAIRTATAGGDTTITVDGAVKGSGHPLGSKAPPAILASSSGAGGILIDGSGAVTSKAGRGIWAQQKSDGLGGVTISGSGTTNGLGRLCPGGHAAAARRHGETGCSGIRAVVKNVADGQDIVINRSGNVRATSAAMDAFTYGNGNISITPGRSARLNGGEFGVETMSSGGGNVTVATSGAKSSIRTGGTGIIAENAASAVAAAQGSQVTVLNEGAITSTGNPFDSLNRRNFDHTLAAITAGYLGGPTPIANGAVAGDVVVTNQGVLSATRGTGILAFHYGTGDIAISNSGTIDARTGVALFGGAGVHAALSNSGGITGRDAAIDLTQAHASTIDQTAGRIKGNILLSGTDDTVNVTGGTIAGRLIADPGAQGAAAGTVNFDAASFRTGGAISAGFVNVTGGTLVLADDITGAVANAATLQVGGMRPRTIDGTYAQTGAGALAVPIGPRGGARLSLTQTADLAGNLEVVVRRGPGGHYAPSGRYTILTAGGGIAGGFTGVTTISKRPLAAPTLTTTPTAVTLTFPQRRQLTAAAITPGETATAAALQTLPARSTLAGAVLSENAAGARQAFDTTSGSLYGSLVTAQFEDSRLVREAVLNRLQETDLSSAPGFWSRGFGDFGRDKGDAQVASLDRSIGGFVLGADAALSGQLSAWRVGFAGAYTIDTLDVGDAGSKASLSTGLGSVYAGARYGAWDLRLGAAVGGTSADVDRLVSFPGFAEAEHGGSGALLTEGFGEIGRRYDVGRAMLEPLLTGAAIRIAQSGFVEQGGAAALVAAGRDYDLGTTTLGLRGEMPLLSSLPLVAHAFLGWQHAYGDVDPKALVAFVAGSSRFEIAGVPIDRDALSAQAGLDWRATSTLTFGMSYSGQVGANAEDHAVKGRIAYAF